MRDCMAKNDALHSVPEQCGGKGQQASQEHCVGASHVASGFVARHINGRLHAFQLIQALEEKKENKLDACLI